MLKQRVPLEDKDNVSLSNAAEEWNPLDPGLKSKTVIFRSVRIKIFSI